ncbi:HEAT repeat domain-containing protein [Pseudenhygromyxa sp. WMMC2535]|uniref:aldo/keto reductase n=1 Tax=Pseudenhygromyxa sp. WMMC2535 TaxID=2712867 RepID=UPI0015539718|nr:aldo/keto reductase [Pseudenhygromyxa sp. WMMC2535]NVB41736.1 HEAT repeat domain-containing protein [Pseudenhygromyxa sp. WMMC2535]
MATSDRRSRLDQGSGDPLVDLLHHDPLVRRFAAAAPSLDEVGRFALRAALLEDRAAAVRVAAAASLARLELEAAEARSRSLGDDGRQICGWLREALDDPSPSVREAACQALARVARLDAPGGRQVCARLVRLIGEEPIWWVRRSACRALAAVGGADEALVLAPLLTCLDDPFWRVRYGVVQALAMIVAHAPGGEDEREALRTRLLAAGEQLEAPGRAALAYLAGAWPEGEDALVEAPAIGHDGVAPKTSRAGLADPDPAVVTARLLAAGPDEVPTRELIALLAESHAALRGEAARRLAVAAEDDPECLRPALAWLEDPRFPNAPAATRKLLAKLGARARPLAEAALADTESWGGAATWAAGWVAEHPAEALHPRLLALLEDPRRTTPGLRRALMGACGAILVRERGRATAMEAAVVAGLDDADAQVRGAAACALARARRGGPHIDLSRWRSFEDPRVRALVLEDPTLDEALSWAGLEDRDGRVRASALRSLDTRLRPAEAARFDAQRRALRRDPDPRVREVVLDPAAAVELADEPDASVRRASAALLERLPWPAITAEARLGLIEHLLRAEDPVLRVRGLALLDPETQLPALLLALRDREAMVRGAADERLAGLDDLSGRIEAVLAKRDGAGDLPLRMAAWPRLLMGAGLEPEAAAERLDAALASEEDAAIRELLTVIGLTLGRPVPVDSESPRVATSASTPAPTPTSAPAPTPEAARADALRQRRPLGHSGLSLAPLVISGAYSLSPASLAFAVERGVDTMFWEPRYASMSAFLRQPKRRGIQVIAGSFHAERDGLLRDLETARRRLGRGCIDLFMLFWVRSPARLSAEALATLRECQARGWIRSYGFSTHDRATACEAVATGDWPVIMTRHSAAHRGAEAELLGAAAEAGVGMLGFSALCYGRMLRPSSVYARGPAPPDCYRYSLAQPAVAACVSAPRRHRELAENLAVLERPELGDEQLEALRAHGREIYADNARFGRLLRRGGAPLREAILALFERGGSPEPAASERDSPKSSATH